MIFLAQGGDAIGEGVKLLNSIQETQGFVGLIAFMLLAYMVGSVLNQFRHGRQRDHQEETEAQRRAAAQEADDKQFQRMLDIIMADRDAAREERAAQAERDREHNRQIGQLATSIANSVAQMAQVVSSIQTLNESVDTSLIAAKRDRDDAKASRDLLHGKIQSATETITAGQQLVVERLEQKIDALVSTIRADCSRDYTPQLTAIMETMLEIQQKITGEHPAAPSEESTVGRMGPNIKEQ